MSCERVPNRIKTSNAVDSYKEKTEYMTSGKISTEHAGRNHTSSQEAKDLKARERKEINCWFVSVVSVLSCNESLLKCP